MHRITFSLIVVFFLITSSVVGVLSASDDDWSMFHHDVQHTGYTTAEGPDTNNVMWNATIPGVVQSSPAFRDGWLYIGSEDGNLYCFCTEPTKGHDIGYNDPDGVSYDLIWKFQTGGAIRSSPAIYDGKVYFGSTDGKVYCIYACIGTEIWNYSAGSPITSSPSIYEHSLYVGSDDGRIFCLNPDTNNSGEVHRWTISTGGSVVSSPAVSNGFFFIGSNDDHVYCFYASNGTELWNYSTGDKVVSSPAVVDGKVYVGSDDGNVYCLYASNGTEYWHFMTSNMVRSSPAVADGMVYVGSDDGNVYCLYASNGTEYWQYLTGDSIRSSPAVADGKIYVGSHDGNIYCINITDGQELWHYATGSPVGSSPAVIHMRLYIASENGNIYCFRNHNPPDVPVPPKGPIVGILGEEYLFISKTSDPEGDPISYLFDWGDGKQTSWLGPFGQQEVVNATHSWGAEGDYQITVKAKDSYGFESNWSQPLTIQINILTIGMLRGGIGIHMEIKNVGERKVWFITWNISYIGGKILNPANGEVSDQIESIPAGESQMVTTGPFFEFGRLKVTIKIQDKYQENIMTKTVNAFAFGYLVFILPW